MTPREKAIDLVNKFKELCDYSSLEKEFALIYINEKLIEFERLSQFFTIDLDYWKEVKKEIEKL